MNNDFFPYDEWISDAMRGVLRRALEKLAVGNFLGEHHLYINFKTNVDDVNIPKFLKTQYPEEMTIVLQHQFDDLYIDEDGFDVTLSFNGQKHRLSIPFNEVTSFSDPSENFVVQIGSETPKSVSRNGELGENNAVQIGVKEKPEKDFAIPQTPVTSSNDTDENSASSHLKNVLDKSDDTKVINIEAFRKK